MEKLDKKQKIGLSIGIISLPFIGIGIYALDIYIKRKRELDLEEKIEAGELLTDEEEIIAERRYTDDYEEYERPSRYIGGTGAVNQPYSIASKRFKILQTHGAKPTEARARAGRRLRQAGEFDSGRQKLRYIEPMTALKPRETGRLRISGRMFGKSY